MTKLPTVDIKGNDYTLVKDRVLYFNKTYPKGSIETELLSDPKDKVIVMKAIIKPDENRVFTGHSQEVVGDGYINKTSALENAETSAVGRALAMMGIGVIESIASADEVNKAGNREQGLKGQIKPSESNPNNLTMKGKCQKCGKEFLKDQAWKKMCFDCYNKKQFPSKEDIEAKAVESVRPSDDLDIPF